MTNTKTRLDAIRARLDAAESFPWEAYGNREEITTIESVNGGAILERGSSGSGYTAYEYTYISHENADLICHAGLDLEYLLDRVSPVSEETIRRAAIRIHADRCCPCDTTGCDYPQDLSEEIKLARLALGVCDDQ